ncbi:PilN domain-containing protein [bacterium]|nr:MAG: PilN domain-containing protein [bacterium]
MNYLATIFKRFRQRSNLLYLQLSEKEVACILFRKKNHTLYIKKQVVLPLESTVIMNGIIYNPTTLAQLISQFTTQHGLIRPKTIMCFADLATHTPALQQLTTLQTALFTVKTPIKLLALVTPPLELNKKSILYTTLASHPDLLTPFKHYNQHGPTWWLGSTCATAGVILLALHSISSILKQDLQTTTSTNEQIQVTTQKLEQNIQQLNQVKQSEEELAKRLTMLNPTKTPFQFSTFLKQLSHAIPPNCWIESLNASAIKNHLAIKSTKKPAATAYTMTMQGNSRSLKAITAFRAQLQKMPSIKEVEPATIKMVKKTPAKSRKCYFFKLSATLKV